MVDFGVNKLRSNTKSFNEIIQGNSQQFTFAQLAKMGFSEDDIQTLSKKYDGKNALTMADLVSAGYEAQVAQMAVDTIPQSDIMNIWEKTSAKGDVGQLPNLLANNKSEKV